MLNWVRWLFGACASGLAHAGRVTWHSLVKYNDTDGEQRAASFAYYAFFALFPLILLLVSIGSIFINQTEVARMVIAFVSAYMPIGDEAGGAVMKTIDTVVNSWKGAGTIALIAIIWSALGLFHALVRGVNRAWGTLEYPWWKLPFKNLLMIAIVGSALMLGVVMPAIVDAIAAYVWRHRITYGVETINQAFMVARSLLPTLVLFYGFTMFYKFAPRGRTSFGDVWIAALVVTILLQLIRNLFVYYVKSSPNFNVVYGTFSSVVALLMWIYLSGSVIIFGGCLSAAQAEARKRAEAPSPEPEVATGKD